MSNERQHCGQPGESEVGSMKGWEQTVDFRVEALVTQCSPHSAGREDFPHPVPRFQPFSPD